MGSVYNHQINVKGERSEYKKGSVFGTIFVWWQIQSLGPT